MMNANGFEAWRRTVARYDFTNPATALVALMRVMSPQRPKAQDHAKSHCRRDTEDSRVHAAATERYPGHGVPQHGTASTNEEVRDKILGYNRLS